MRSFWKNSEIIARRLVAARRLLLALDFDGTLASLAETPEDAGLTADFKSALTELSEHACVYVFILSGRALQSVRDLVGLENVYYGGNHGMEIAGPDLMWQDKAASKAKKLVEEICSDLRERFPPGTGVLVEDKAFSASVHYNHLKPAYRRGFFSRMKAIMTAQSRTFRWRGGYKVFDLLPKGAAHKGDAVAMLARRLGCGLDIAVGDDLTDEDMFETLAGKGITVRVGRKAGSKAGYFLDGQAEVLKFLRFISERRSAVMDRTICRGAAEEVFNGY